ncbi:uncharacterized protein OCT59_017319 [Rhizophagus irregularis]|uniref:Uncharacterized protein n=1 Tax=Rhizophagus irregularis (strain DAOM 197198w) TaxID=1432141 RepID=A0A015M1K1_RHIIW|nr:hypothetical protein RirG_011050 [Rhizophagus irregularis DAOM 197198w]UZO25032.1 hypothetical protein OCT59_017319 [Rhizophagus irregularis]GBC50277.1 hypothetical protein RIR_jg21694.t1 [Rhizophagus irregularis DAOM 181602=DAOM 197198]
MSKHKKIRELLSFYALSDIIPKAEILNGHFPENLASITITPPKFSGKRPFGISAFGNSYCNPFYVITACQDMENEDLFEKEGDSSEEEDDDLVMLGLTSLLEIRYLEQRSYHVAKSKD